MPSKTASKSLDATQTAALLLLATEERGGITYSLADGSEPSRGYAVGRPPYGLILSPQRDELDRVHKVANWLTNLPGDVSVVGTWHNTEDGATYVDAVDVFPYQPDAHHAAEARGELAYYSLHDGHTIRVHADSHA